MSPQLSVVIPVYNERESISQFHEEITRVCEAAKLSYELIYIDDHSSDGTFAYLTSVSDETKVRVYRKVGKKGKAFSLDEGFAHARGEFLAMIDADLQYPPSAIPHMLAKAETTDIIVANRKKHHTSILRKFFSRGFRILFGRMLCGLNTDVQSGLKVFRREAFHAARFTPRSAWTFDLEFLYRAREAGFSYANYDIVFSERLEGKSKVRFFQQIFEIGTNALRVRMTRIPPLAIPPNNPATMIGAGIGYKKRKYITHTTIPHTKTALKTFLWTQKVFIFVVLALLIGGSVFRPLQSARLLVSIISVVYFLDVTFNLFIILRSLVKDHELKVSEKTLHALDDASLPIYSILCPLYKESAVLPQFLSAIAKLDWPKEKLDVLLLLEQDDKDMREVVKGMNLPTYVRVVIVPTSQPKTKPKACNYGLNLARGEYIVIYDAEDMPDPLQLKKAYVVFQHVSPEVACLQAKLNYYNPHQNLLTSFFTAEYSLWFDLTLTGLQSIDTAIPLGGTSNHFKTAILRKLQGWDTFNVTEDADLGIRLFKDGYKTAIIDSVTLEEANSKPRNWIRQRSRWIKGYMQSYLVHMRDFRRFIRMKGIHAFLFQLIVGCKLIFIFINPLLWIVTFAYFALYTIAGPTIELVYMTPAFYIAVISLVFGNFLFLYYYMLGSVKREHWGVIKYVLLIPMYWIMLSIAGWVAVYQLIFKPHYWEKTVHGLHLGTVPVKPVVATLVVKPVSTRKSPFAFPRPAFAFSLSKRLKSFMVFFLVVSVPIGLQLALLFSGKQDVFVYVASGIVALGVLFLFVLVLRLLKPGGSILQNNVSAFIHLFTSRKKEGKTEKLSILIFNWRDSRHVWAGGAEVYVQEIARRWVQEGKAVTVFCGNDGRSPQNQIVNGIHIIRRGGTYTVYVWAFLYYILKFRGKFDVVIDCENGIPFFTPLYVGKPLVLLIHHVHQEVFRDHLRFPLSWIAATLESRLMPLLYRNRPIVTVSESSKKEILNLGFSKPENIEIVYNGIDSTLFAPVEKTFNPSFIYLGRLKAYKNIDVCIKAFAKVMKLYPRAILHIVGEGAEMYTLQSLAQSLGVEKQVVFHGRVSDRIKAKLLAQSWVMIQPSMVEGWGLTVIEANVSGTPVIASNVNGLKDSVIHGETGLLVQPNSVKEFSQAMQTMIENPALMRYMSAQAISWSHNFTWEKSAHDFFSLIEKIVTGKTFVPVYGKLILAKTEHLS